MNKFIKNVCSAIAITCGSAMLVGSDYCAYASQCGPYATSTETQIDIGILTSENEASLRDTIKNKCKLPNIDRFRRLSDAELVQSMKKLFSLNKNQRKQISNVEVIENIGEEFPGVALLAYSQMDDQFRKSHGNNIKECLKRAFNVQDANEMVKSWDDIRKNHSEVLKSASALCYIRQHNGNGKGMIRAIFHSNGDRNEWPTYVQEYAECVRWTLLRHIKKHWLKNFDEYCEDWHTGQSGFAVCEMKDDLAVQALDVSIDKLQEEVTLDVRDNSMLHYEVRNLVVNKADLVGSNQLDYYIVKIEKGDNEVWFFKEAKDEFHKDIGDPISLTLILHLPFFKVPNKLNNFNGIDKKEGRECDFGSLYINTPSLAS